MRENPGPEKTPCRGCIAAREILADPARAKMYDQAKAHLARCKG